MPNITHVFAQAVRSRQPDAKLSYPPHSYTHTEGSPNKILRNDPKDPFMKEAYRL
ncbi:hypothetical protein HK102_006061, partial [Quaeritorhiza haematococci]